MSLFTAIKKRTSSKCINIIILTGVINTHTHTHTHIYINIYIYIYMCVYIYIYANGLLVQ